MNDINELDVNDIGLKQIMGDRFEDLTEESIQMHEAPKSEPKTERKVHYIPMGDEEPTERKVWSPFDAEPSFTQRLADCAKWVCLFSGLCLLFFYWQQTGQMLSSASLPAMCACTAMVGWAIGKNFRGKK